MKGMTYFLLALIVAGCTQDYDTNGVVYSGKANLNNRIRQFTASTTENEKDIILNMTGQHELTFHFNSEISHIDYEKEVIIFRSETDHSEWTVRKVQNGFELEDGTLLQYGNCRGWIVCLIDESTKLPILKGSYTLSGSNAKITLWISDHQKHVELLGLMANGLLNRSKKMNEASFETVSPQVWTY